MESEGKLPQRISGVALRDLLHGKMISNSDLARPNYVTFGERFNEDGSWGASFQTRMLTQLSGRWRIVDNQVCVEVKGEEERCRAVYLEERPDIYSIAGMLPSWKEDHVFFRTF